MEPAGLAIGAIALASLFTGCIECLDLIEVARSSEEGLNTQVCKLSIIKRQFMVWGESIGLLSPDQGRDDVLDQIKGRQEIEDVLRQISTLLQDAERLKTKYGVEVDRTDDRHSDSIEVSKRRRDVFKQNPIVEFISRLAAHQRRSTIITKTRWAIRDSKKFEGLVKDLDWFVTKLITVDVSHETHIRQEMATREEVESIVDLSTLTIMEQTCRGPTRSWAAAARIHSEYLSSAGSVVERNQRIRDWNAQLKSTGSDSQSMSVHERTRKRHADEALSPSLSMTSLTRRDSPPLRLPKKRNGPGPNTKVYIFSCHEPCLQEDTRENLLSISRLAKLADEWGDPSKFADLSAYYEAREKVVWKTIDSRGFQSEFISTKGEYRARGDSQLHAKIHVFCPPLLQYIHFALALAYGDPGLEFCKFQVVIHPDDRLLDESLYSVEEGRISMLQLSDFVRHTAYLGGIEPTDSENESRQHFLATRFDQVWMDQRITALGSNKPTGNEVDASEFFEASKEAVQVAFMVIMAGSQVCDNITRTAPLACPDNPVQPSQIYRLEELADMDDNSLFRWKTTHFCRINLP